jgi:urease subunit beta
MAKQNTTPNPAAALYGAGAGFVPAQPVPIGGVVLRSEEIEYNAGRPTTKIKVRNTGDRPIQVGSHFHFFEVNRYLAFDREAAFGTHLNIPATTAIRFEPGDSKEVEVVTYGGKRRIIGFNALVNGYTGCEDAPTYFPTRNRAIRKMKKRGFKCSSEQTVEAEAAADKKSTTTKPTSKE